jgi:hypothetical protein
MARQSKCLADSDNYRPASLVTYILAIIDIWQTKASVLPNRSRSHCGSRQRNSSDGAQVILDVMAYVADDNSGASTANEPRKELLSDV